MRLLILALLSTNAFAGPYVELGLGVPLSPDTGYTPDMYGIAALGYIHRFDEIVSLDIGFAHKSLTGTDKGMCGDGTMDCYGDNVVETKLRLEW